MSKLKSYKSSDLLTLMNVGAATFKDLELLGVGSISELAHASTDELYTRLQVIIDRLQDPCV